MISVFDSRTRRKEIESRNGDIVLDRITSSAVISEELGGNFNLDLTVEIIPNFNNELYEPLKVENIIKCDDENGTQVFRITKVEKLDDSYLINARHICLQDLFTYYLEDVRPTDKTGQRAMDELDKLSIANVKEIDFTSDIQNVSTAYFVNKNMYQALFDSENSFIERWGGEVKCNMFNLAINSRIGVDKGTTIRSGKNLTKFEMFHDIDNLCTRIYPQGFDGITIKEKFIDSPIINNYARIYPKQIKFDDIKVKKPVEEGQEPSEEDKDAFDTIEQAQAEMIKRSKEMFNVDKVDYLNNSYRIDFVELSRTEEYKHFKVLETVNIGDSVTIIDSKSSVNIKARVTKRQYDLIKRERKATELSIVKAEQKKISTQSLQHQINKIPPPNDIISKANSYTNTMLSEGIPNSSVICKRDEFLVLTDTKDIATSKKLYKWTSKGLQYTEGGYNGVYKTILDNKGNTGDLIGILNIVNPNEFYDIPLGISVNNIANIISLFSSSNGGEIEYRKFNNKVSVKCTKTTQIDYRITIKTP